MILGNNAVGVSLAKIDGDWDHKTYGSNKYESFHQLSKHIQEYLIMAGIKYELELQKKNRKNLQNSVSLKSRKRITNKESSIKSNR